MDRLTRRGILGAALATGPVLGAAQAATVPAGGPASPSDEAYWGRVAAQYDLTDEVVQLENGNWGVMSRPVLEAYERHQRMVNRRNSYYSRRE